ncbi:hypothetical protein K6V18_24135 [Ralstonia insidiosa]|nr:MULTISPECIES: hypothetical protein [Ralstonia]MBY4708131.1 hypothetical protein [Ralstonia insidiosa]
MSDIVIASDGISKADAEGASWVADFIRTRAIRPAYTQVKSAMLRM